MARMQVSSCPGLSYPVQSLPILCCPILHVGGFGRVPSGQAGYVCCVVQVVLQGRSDGSSRFGNASRGLEIQERLGERERGRER